MEFYQLNYFKTLCEAKSYTNASSILNVSQPTITISIKKLEEELGGNLIDRQKKDFALTPMGEAFLLRCKVILSEMDLTYKEMNSYSHKYRENIRIALPNNLCSHFVEDLFDRFSTKEQKYPIFVSRHSQKTIIRCISNKIFDFGVVCEDAVKDMPGIGIKEFKSIQLGIYCGDDPAFKGRGSVPIGELNGRKVLLSEHGGILSGQIRKFLDENDVHPVYNSYLDDDLNTLESMHITDHGHGISFIPLRQSPEDCILLEPALNVSIVVIWSKRTSTKAVISMNKKIIDFICQM